MDTWMEFINTVLWVGFHLYAMFQRGKSRSRNSQHYQWWSWKEVVSAFLWSDDSVLEPDSGDDTGTHT